MFSVVIPSANPNNLIPCVKSILEKEDISPRQIIVVDDGAKEEAYRKLPIGIQWVQGIKPFVFARNCNLGINEAGENDIILLNDDAVLKTPKGFSSLTEVTKSSGYGVVSAVTNASGNVNQTFKTHLGLKDEPKVLCFICVCIPRATINAVGLLDERFTAYGFDDNDYCKRTLDAGLKLGIYDGCFVDHTSLVSTYRGKGHLSLAPGQKIYNDKWRTC